MKTKQVLTVMMTSLFLIYGCSNNQDSNSDSELVSKGLTSKSSDTAKGSSVINQEYAQAQAEVMETFMAIRQSIMDGAGLGKYTENMDQLISFHAYGDKFTEFNYDPYGQGELIDSDGNETHERTLFGETVDPGGVTKFAFMPGTLKIAVYYGNVANLTFISDFELVIGGTTYPVNNLITLLFVKTKGQWKMVHEHHSPISYKTN